MKKIAVLVLAVLILSVSCANKTETLICGVTQFEPMNFLDTNGNWTGFDTEFALLVGKKLGMKVEFQEITWSQKFVELQSGAINCIWNGMTANTVDGTTGRPRHEDVDFSYSYLLNQQCVVIRTSRAGDFSSQRDLIGKIAAAEKGSAGETIAVEAIGARGTMIDKTKQIDTFMEVLSGAVDFAVVDSILAHRLAGTGDFSGLMVADIPLGSRMEVYAIGFRKGSDLVERVNNAIMELYNEGKLYEIAAKYGLRESLVIGTDPIR
ncbi:MAG: transporter substrate-binding domain-containing protein [Treponema sp.]|nr:transporter substrate-binding domain-containing protein [Treponema sp.]